MTAPRTLSRGLGLLLSVFKVVSRCEKTFNRPFVRLGLEVLEDRCLPSVATPDYILAHRAGSGAVNPNAALAPTGYSPAQVRHAYGIDQVSLGGIVGDGSGQTIALIDAYDDPAFVSSTNPGFINSDLHRFDQAFGLPDPPRFTKVAQDGSSVYPPPNAGWATEIALDVEWAHALAPGASILLVEARDNNYFNLVAAINWARQQPGVSVVSMSFSSPEFAGEASFDGVFTSPSGHGVTFLAATGDSGAPGGYPAASPNVVAVGGTTLNLIGSDYAGESAWTGSGGGLSPYEAQPSYQRGVVSQSGTLRATPDVSFDADPYTGVPIYDSFNGGTSPWEQVGGTSFAAPAWAALIAIANQGRALLGQGSLDGATQTLPLLYSLPASDFHDITMGSNGYQAGPGYDLATGRGSPIASKLVPDLVGKPDAIVRKLYLTVLARPATQAEVTSWDNFYAQFGLTALVQGIDRSTEARLLLVRGWYKQYLGRPAGNSEALSWVAYLQGHSEEQAQAAILSSAEFYARAQGLVATGTADQRYLQALYQVMLNRSAAPAEVNVWLGILAAHGRTAVALAIASSVEFRGNAIRTDYTTLLGRTPSSAEVMSWATLPLPLLNVREGLLLGQEFIAGA
jgi:hypothetical protein